MFDSLYFGSLVQYSPLIVFLKTLYINDEGGLHSVVKK